ncbi:hypothetical protein DL771_008485 [Monosporascus sp. 5C6A]|nr:hypothetical protein DL771_008485 [Monosporascus sp. 5C6A]
MRKTSFLFAVAWQSRQAVLAVPVATDHISSYPAAAVETHDKYWASYMEERGYPSNEDVCGMIRDEENDLFSRSWAKDYYHIWMSDNGFIMVHIIHTGIVNIYSALRSADIRDYIETPLANLDLRTLVTDFVWRESDWQNGDAKMSAFAPILFMLAGFLGPAGEAGLVRGLAATEEHIAGTIGSFQFNTVVHSLSQAAYNRGGGYLDIAEIADELPTELGSVFDDTNNYIAALTEKLFGGTSSKTLLHIDLMEFVNTILPTADGKERMGGEAYAPWYLLQQNYQDWDESTDTLRSYFHNSFKYMEWLDGDRCHNDFDGASRYIDNSCFVLKVGGGGWKHLNHDDNAPTELNLAEEKYGLNLHNFFRNVRDCNNDERVMEYGEHDMGELVPYPIQRKLAKIDPVMANMGT